MSNRRALIKAATSLLIIGSASACKKQPAPEQKPVRILTAQQQRYEESRARMKAKFGDRGAGLIVDAMKGATIFDAVRFSVPDADRPFFSTASQHGDTELGTVVRSFLGVNEIPERARVIYRDSADERWNAQHLLEPVGNVIWDETIDVGSRIPASVVTHIEDLRKRRIGGGLVLKFRMHPEGTLLGWDVRRAQSLYEYGQTDCIDPPEQRLSFSIFSLADGDFREAAIVNGEPIRKGWYIHPKTKERIETDF